MGLNHGLWSQSPSCYRYTMRVYIAPFRPPRHAGTCTIALGTLALKGRRTRGSFFWPHGCRPCAMVGGGFPAHPPSRQKGGNRLEKEDTKTRSYTQLPYHTLKLCQNGLFMMLVANTSKHSPLRFYTLEVLCNIC